MRYSDWRVCLSGGTSNNGAQAGVSALNANNDSTNSNPNIGSHLSFNQEYPWTLPLGKIQNA
jgi:hypothetical protein